MYFLWSIVLSIYSIFTHAYLALCFYYWFIIGVVPFDVPFLTYFEMMGMLIFVRWLTNPPKMSVERLFYGKQVNDAFKRDEDERNEVYTMHTSLILLSPWVILGVFKLVHLIVF